jgi:hypothetical protein
MMRSPSVAKRRLRYEAYVGSQKAAAPNRSRKQFREVMRLCRSLLRLFVKFITLLHSGREQSGAW